LICIAEERIALSDSGRRHLVRLLVCNVLTLKLPGRLGSLEKALVQEHGWNNEYFDRMKELLRCVCI
jgi:hypothetical protein